jgi:hypothetical protein
MMRLMLMAAALLCAAAHTVPPRHPQHLTHRGVRAGAAAAAAAPAPGADPALAVSSGLASEERGRAQQTASQEPQPQPKCTGPSPAELALLPRQHDESYGTVWWDEGACCIKVIGHIGRPETAFCVKAR